MNRGVLITPFHSMLLMCPASTQADGDRYIDVLETFCADLVAACAAGKGAAS
jgi:glutamate-1-semialdehyde 2,1-aminomutase